MRRRNLFIFLSVVFALSAVAAAFNLPVAAAVGDEVVSAYVDQDLPLADPDSSMWNQAAAIDVALSGQALIAPKNEAPSIDSMRVQSLNNGKWIAFLLEWDDPTLDTGGNILDYKDSAAIQFPSESGEPFYCMGQSGGLVEILHWRSDFQKDIEVGLPNAKEIFPNMWSSIYPAAESADYLTGQGAGNPLSLAAKASPVEDLVAGGFGTLESQVHRDAVGWANWSSGKWKAVIARPMITVDEEDAQFDAGTQTSVALAAWDGGQNEINGDKSVSTWVTLKVEGPTMAPSTAPDTGVTQPIPGPTPEPQVIVQKEYPNSLIIATIAIFAAATIIASGITWVLARRR